MVMGASQGREKTGAGHEREAKKGHPMKACTKRVQEYRVSRGCFKKHLLSEETRGGGRGALDI